MIICIVCIKIYNTKEEIYLIIKLDFNSSTPIYVQLRNQIVMGIGKGDLSFGESLPTVRQMAEDTGINAMTVNKAYSILKNEGFIIIDRRHGAKVNPLPDKNIEFKEKIESELSLVISEASVKGIDKDEFMGMCSKLFDEIRVSRPITD